MRNKMQRNPKEQKKKKNIAKTLVPEKLIKQLIINRRHRRFNRRRHRLRKIHLLRLQRVLHRRGFLSQVGEVGADGAAAGDGGAPVAPAPERSDVSGRRAEAIGFCAGRFGHPRQGRGRHDQIMRALLQLVEIQLRQRRFGGRRFAVHLRLFRLCSDVIHGFRLEADGGRGLLRRRRSGGGGFVGNWKRRDEIGLGNLEGIVVIC